MIDAGNIIETEAIPQPAQPPAVASAAVIIPAVQGIAPQLAVCGKAVRRTARNRYGHIFLIQLEEFRIGPGVGGVHGHIDRYVADDFDALAVGVGLQLPPLFKELVLQILLEFDIVVQLAAVVIHCESPSQANILGPFIPASAVKEILDCHEQRIIRKPPVVLLNKLQIGFVVHYIAALISLAQKRIADVVHDLIVDVVLFSAIIDCVAFLLGEHALFDQILQADEIGIACEGGEGLIGGITVAGLAQGQNLPVGLARILQPIHKIISFLRETADAVFGGQAEDGKQNTGFSCHSQFSPFVSISMPKWSDTTGSCFPLNTTRDFSTGASLLHQI